MKWWQTAWLQKAWPRVLAGTGFAIVWGSFLAWLVWGRTPNEALLAVAVGLLWPAAQKHVKTLLGAQEAGSSSESSPPPSSPPSRPPSPPAARSGDHPAGHGDGQP